MMNVPKTLDQCPPQTTAPVRKSMDFLITTQKLGLIFWSCWKACLFPKKLTASWDGTWFFSVFPWWFCLPASTIRFLKKLPKPPQKERFALRGMVFFPEKSSSKLLGQKALFTWCFFVFEPIDIADNCWWFRNPACTYWGWQLYPIVKKVLYFPGGDRQTSSFNFTNHSCTVTCCCL